MLFIALGRVVDIWEWIGIIFTLGLLGKGDTGFAPDHPAQSRQLVMTIVVAHVPI